MRFKWAFRVALCLGLILLPLGAHWLFRVLTDGPRQLRIASGPEGGRYGLLAQQLKVALESQCGVAVEVVPSGGSLDNLRLLREGAVDAALYQHGAERMLFPAAAADNGKVRFVANLYSEVCHLFARRGANVAAPEDLRGKRVAIASRRSGDYVVTRVVLGEFGLDADAFQPLELSYPEIREGFRAGTLDAAIIAAGVQAPIYRELAALGACDICPIPHAEVLAQRHLALAPYTIPSGMYSLAAPAYPPRDIQTVAVRAQLIARDDLPSGLVEEVTRVALSEEFVRTSGLAELYSRGAAFAREKPEFPSHRGALNYYEPELRPLLNPEFVDATEGMRSLIVSAIIAGYLLFRWVKTRRARQHEHRLDRYIRQLLDIERRQLDLDQTEGWADLAALQDLLDEVTRLRQEALAVFSAHDLNEDRAVDCLLEMCHALSDKINAKISRQRLDKRFAALEKALNP